jgi:23S rRNA (guanine745-N1)-methyltransferase
MYRCPLCHQALQADQNAYRCPSGHHFDQHRSGYLHLLSKPRKQRMGDDDAMIMARHHFLQQEHYAFLKNRLIELIKTLPIQNLVDLGCGNGYYTNAFQNAFPKLNVYGFDLSKLALRLASQKSKAHYAISSIADLPLMSHQCDLATAIFVPHQFDELMRILKPEGYVIIVSPGPNHLLELKQFIYHQVILNTLPEVDKRFKVIHQEQITTSTHLNGEDCLNLYQMTPYVHRSSPELLSRFQQDLKMQMTFEFNILVLQAPA